MALPPTIPTSFVPRQPLSAVSRPQKSGNNLFLYGALGVLGFVVFVSLAAFAYKLYLTDVRNAKAAQLAAAQKDIDASTVEQFVRLRDRLAASGALLDNHVELSQFFDKLGAITVASVSFDTLKVTVADDRTATIELTGTAKSFNALAAQSAAFANAPGIKRAIFSGFTAQKDGSVSFTVDANLDSSLVQIPAAGAGNAAASTAAPAAVNATTSVPVASPALQTAIAPAAPKAASTTTTASSPAVPPVPVKSATSTQTSP